MHDFVNSDNPWFVRGNSNNDNPTNAGVFTFNRNNGKPNPKLVFRSVLAYYNI